MLPSKGRVVGNHARAGRLSVPTLWLRSGWSQPPRWDEVTRHIEDGVSARSIAGRHEGDREGARAELYGDGVGPIVTHREVESRAARFVGGDRADEQTVPDGAPVQLDLQYDIGIR
jgi:hypothetical protein